MPRANLEIRRITPLIGAEIHGIDLTRELDEPTYGDLRQALLDHLVIVLPGQRIRPTQQLSFARRFGEVEPPHPVFETLAEQPEITIIQHGGEGAQPYNDEWHTDVTFRAEPAMGTVLHAQVLPEIGGDTLWANMYAAYDSLSPCIRELINDMVAVHDYYRGFADVVLGKPGGQEKLLGDLRNFPPVEHPVVRMHPETKRKGLFVNRSFTRRIKGLTTVESDHLLALLFEHAEHPNFQMRHRWRLHDLVMWDNRCTMHLAASDFVGLRRMHRITVLGDRPVSAVGIRKAGMPAA
jgi:taurine dioxygenase